MNARKSDEIDTGRRIRFRTMEKKLEVIEENEISDKDIVQLIKKLNLDINEDIAKKIFEEVDKQKLGKVSKSLFIEHLEQANKEDHSYLLFTELNKTLNTKCIIMIEKMKKILAKVKVLEDEELNEDLRWITETIINQDIYEPDFNGNELPQDPDYLGMLTNVEMNKRKEEDIKNITATEKPKSISIFGRSKKQT